MGKLVRPGFTPLVYAAFLLIAATAAAQPAPTWPYGRGNVAFHYQQWPIGSYAGDFQAEGHQFEGPFIPEDSNQAVGGLCTSVQDTTTAFWYAAVLESDQSVDLSLLWVRKPGAELTPGEYHVDVLGRSVLFAFIDGITDFTPPDDFGSFDPSAWLGSITYEHLFMAISGTVSIDQIDNWGFGGTFSGVASDTGLMFINISSGTFWVRGPEVGNEAASWGDVKALYR
ncbi:MAG: hypothetical protein Q7W56_04485 [Candidatus Latescibacteria bacterium]|nr:hypothetical protein [Candidatus Latescibacterota bacterium]